MQACVERWGEYAASLAAGAPMEFKKVWCVATYCKLSQDMREAMPAELQAIGDAKLALLAAERAASAAITGDRTPAAAKSAATTGTAEGAGVGAAEGRSGRKAAQQRQREGAGEEEEGEEGSGEEEEEEEEQTEEDERLVLRE